MQFQKTLLAILSGVALSAALAIDVLTVDVRITSEELKQPNWPVTQHPISALGGKFDTSPPTHGLLQNRDTPLSHSTSSNR